MKQPVPRILVGFLVGIFAVWSSCLIPYDFQDHAAELKAIEDKLVQSRTEADRFYELGKVTRRQSPFPVSVG
jgi:hypothetical protein